jgi:hypothetical protein
MTTFSLLLLFFKLLLNVTVVLDVLQDVSAKGIIIIEKL